MPSWLSRNTGEEAPKNDDNFEVQLKPHFDTLKNEISQNVNQAIAAGISDNPVLLNMQKFLNAQEEAERQAQELAQQRAQHQNQSQFENLDTTAKTYVDQQVSRLAQDQLATTARLVRREIFEDAENYPYYTGELKKKIDDMIDAEPPANRANPMLIKNVYKLCAFDAQKEIEQGKIKSRLSSASASAAPSNSTTVNNPSAPLTEDEKFYVRKMGISEDSYIKSKQELAAMEGSLV